MAGDGRTPLCYHIRAPACGPTVKTMMRYGSSRRFADISTYMREPGMEVTLLLVVIILLIYLIDKRIKDRDKEDFEKRDN